jgi:hypothetical protein
MPGRTDRPGSGPDRPDRPHRPDRPEPGPADDLRRRLDSLPPSHPSSPWYRAGRRQDGSPEGTPGSSRSARSEKSGVNRAGQDAAGAAAGAAAARAARKGRPPDGSGRTPEQEKRAANDALWAQAARWHAADKARRQAREKGAPAAPPARREPFRPWFADGTGDELWLSADGTGEPWFAPGGDGER